MENSIFKENNEDKERKAKELEMMNKYIEENPENISIDIPVLSNPNEDHYELDNGQMNDTFRGLTEFNSAITKEIVDKTVEHANNEYEEKILNDPRAEELANIGASLEEREFEVNTAISNILDEMSKIDYKKEKTNEDTMRYDTLRTQSIELSKDLTQIKLDLLKNQEAFRKLNSEINPLSNQMPENN